MKSISSLRIAILLLLFVGALANPAVGRPFRFDEDTLEFANDTFWAYELQADGQLRMHAQAAPPPYTRHCLVMVRAVLQFHRFAEFRPDLPRLTPEEYRRVVKRVARIPAWSRRTKRIPVPGFASLRAFSAAMPRLLQDELGLWWPTYWRVGNWRMATGFPRAGQDALAMQLCRAIRRGEVCAVFITRFRPLNHAMVAYESKRTAAGDIVFTCYDPNEPGHPLMLVFNAEKRSFTWPKTPYWPGGQVNGFQVYLSPFR